MPTEVSEKDFTDFLDKIIYAKTERLTSKKDGRILQMFTLEIKDEAEAEALISLNLTCHITGISTRWKNFSPHIKFESTPEAALSSSDIPKPKSIQDIDNDFIGMLTLLLLLPAM